MTQPGNDLDIEALGRQLEEADLTPEQLEKVAEVIKAVQLFWWKEGMKRVQQQIRSALGL